MRIKALLLLGWLCCWLCNCRGANLVSVISVDATVNHHPVRLTLDTGADGIYLFRSAAQRLTLETTVVPEHQKATNGAGQFLALTEKCDIAYLGRSEKLRLGVINRPAFWSRDTDGLLGWPALRRFIFEMQLEGTNTVIHFLKSPPNDTKGWVRVPLDRSASQLLLQFRDGRLTNSAIMFDTGAQSGITLSSKRWQELKASNPQMPLAITICKSFYEAVPTAVEESFARNLAFGSLSLTNVPILEGPAPVFDHSSDIMLGLAALTSMDVIIDGKHSCAYLRPKAAPAFYRHNRAGVVFLPRDFENFDAFAHVIPGSPADEAGVRDGDIIMKCDGKWRTEWDESPNELFCDRPAGTKVDLVLKRGEKSVNATITLRDILPLTRSASATK